MDKITTEYEGFKIVYLENSNEWKVLDDGEHGDKRKPTLTEAKAWIDNTFKVKKKNTFQRQPGLKRSHMDGIVKVQVTSYAGWQWKSPYYWITNEDGRREKKDGIRQYDEATYQQILDKVKERDALTKAIDNLWESIPLFTAGQEGGE